MKKKKALTELVSFNKPTHSPSALVFLEEEELIYVIGGGECPALQSCGINTDECPGLISCGTNGTKEK